MKTFCRRDDIVTRHIGDETILVPVKNNLADMLNLFVLDAVGECVWRALEDLRNMDEICARVCCEFDTDEETARGDCERFIEELVGADLLIVK